MKHPEVDDGRDRSKNKNVSFKEDQPQCFKDQPQCFKDFSRDDHPTRRDGSEDMEGFSNESYHHSSLVIGRYHSHTNSSLVIGNQLVVDISKGDDDGANEVHGDNIDDQRVQLPDEDIYEQEVETKSNNMLKNAIVEPCDSSVDRRVFAADDVQGVGNVAVLRRNAVVENGYENTFQHLKRYIVQQNVDEYF